MKFLVPEPCARLLDNQAPPPQTLCMIDWCYLLVAQVISVIGTNFSLDCVCVCVANMCKIQAKHLKSFIINLTSQLNQELNLTESLPLQMRMVFFFLVLIKIKGQRWYRA